MKELTIKQACFLYVGYLAVTRSRVNEARFVKEDIPTLNDLRDAYHRIKFTMFKDLEKFNIKVSLNADKTKRIVALGKVSVECDKDFYSIEKAVLKLIYDHVDRNYQTIKAVLGINAA